MNTQVDQAQAIAKLNDRFRKGDRSLGMLVCTPMVASLPPKSRVLLKRAVATFEGFNKDNDAYHEHDFGSIVHDGEKYFWKISYYDQNCEYGSEAPENAAITRRV